MNPSLARACGIPTRRVVALAWFASGVMAGLGGVALFLEIEHVLGDDRARSS